METWMSEYERQLTKIFAERTEDYLYPLSDVPQVVAKMREAFRNGTYNKDGNAVKACCKFFGIKNTYKDIERFIANHA